MTFDDGYADNTLFAAPILRDHGIPATFFIVSDHVGAEDEFWWDLLERLLLDGRSKPDGELDVRAGALEGSWPMDTPARRFAAHAALHRIMMGMAGVDRSAALEQIAQWRGGVDSPRPSYRCMTSAELAGLASDPLFELGAHTRTHAYLSALDPQEQQREIAGSRSYLERELDVQVRSFAYPYGNYGTETPGIVAEAGFSIACSTYPVTLGRRADPLALGRFAVEDWDADSFGRFLEQTLTDG